MITTQMIIKSTKRLVDDVERLKRLGRKPLEPRKIIKISESNYDLLKKVSGNTFNEKISSLLGIRNREVELIQRPKEYRDRRDIPESPFIDSHILANVIANGPSTRADILNLTFKTLDQKHKGQFSVYFEGWNLTKSVFQNNIDNRLKTLVRYNLLDWEHKKLSELGIDRKIGITRVYSFALPENKDFIDTVNEIAEMQLGDFMVQGFSEKAKRTIQQLFRIEGNPPLQELLQDLQIELLFSLFRIG